jgi:hypothetical protein
MTAISKVGCMHPLKQVGFTDQQSEVQASQLEQVIANVEQDLKQELHSDDLATKKDLEILRLATQKDIEALKLSTQRDIEALRYEMFKFIVWTGVGVVVTLGSTLGTMLAKGFHWF